MHLAQIVGIRSPRPGSFKLPVGVTRLVSTLVMLAAFAPVAAAQQIVELRAGAPGVLAVIVETGPHAQTDPASLALTLGEWAVDGVTPGALHRYSIPWDEDKDLLVTVRHRVYLDVASGFEPGRTYSIQTPYGARSFAFDPRQTYCEAIKVNQVGYHEGATSRFANFGVYLGDGGARFYDPAPAYEVVEEGTGQVISNGNAVYMGDDTLVTEKGVTSGEHVYRLSLSAVPSGGPYYVVVPGCGRSRSFGVGESYSREIARVMARGLYHQRSGIALEQPHTEFTRGACHEEVADTRTPWTAQTFIPVPEGMPTFSISGGYHDAADFDRRPMHMIIPILMLSYFEAFPEHFTDGQYSIPESGNGVPDFLDEAMWSLLVWDKLQVTDPADADFGAVRMGTERDRHPGYGHHSAANEDVVYGTFEVGIETTALSAGVFAQASRLIQPFDPARSADLLAKARLAWAWVVAHDDVHAVKTMHMYAALQLYLATGEAEFHDIFRAAAVPIVLAGGAWPEQYIPGNTTAKAQTVHFVSYLLTDQETDPMLRDALVDRILSGADHGTYMGPPPEGEPYPQGATKFLAWGAATAQGRYADLYCFAHRFSQDAPKRQSYFNAMSQYADFALGLNPLGMSFVTGLGTDQPRSPLHLDSYFTKYGLSDGVTSDHLGTPIGNVPGITVYGPTDGRSGASYQLAVSDKLYPEWDSLPALRRWGDGWSLVNGNEFTTWETVVWGAVLHGCLYDDAAQSQAPAPTQPAAPILLP